MPDNPLIFRNPLCRIPHNGGERFFFAAVGAPAFPSDRADRRALVEAGTEGQNASLPRHRSLFTVTVMVMSLTAGRMPRLLMMVVMVIMAAAAVVMIMVVVMLMLVLAAGVRCRIYMVLHHGGFSPPG